MPKKMSSTIQPRSIALCSSRACSYPHMFRIAIITYSSVICFFSLNVRPHTALCFSVVVWLSLQKALPGCVLIKGIRLIAVLPIPPYQYVCLINEQRKRVPSGSCTVPSHDAMPRSRKREGAPTLHGSMDGPGEHYTK